MIVYIDLPTSKLKNAWDVARVYAQVEGISKDRAFKRLFIEVPEDHD